MSDLLKEDQCVVKTSEDWLANTFALLFIPSASCDILTRFQTEEAVESTQILYIHFLHGDYKFHVRRLHRIYIHGS